MKVRILFSLLFLWVFALLTPSIVTLIEKSKTSFVFNLIEEEQKECMEWDADQKQLAKPSQFDFYFQENSKIAGQTAYEMAAPAPLFEIILPPPEHTL